MLIWLCLYGHYCIDMIVVVLLKLATIAEDA